MCDIERQIPVVEIPRSVLQILPKILKVVTEKDGMLSRLPLNDCVNNVCF